jgi:flagellar motility protein MotE (MotC chaperone)
MTRWLRDFRLLPIALAAIGCLFALKAIGLMFDGGYTLGQRLGGNGTLVVTTVPGSSVAQMRSPSVPLDLPSGQQATKISWMQEMFNYPGGGDITGSVSAAKPKEPEKKEQPVVEPPESKAANGTAIVMDQSRPASAAERALLERLQERRQELDARARALDLRESMLKAAEKKLETQVSAEKTEAAKGGAGASAAQRKDEAENARFKSVVTMYETMKAKDAAKIFDRLDIRVLLEVASAIKPTIMSAILAQMSTEAAERLTVELAARGPVDRAINPANLPKIDGRPSGT